MRAEVDHHDGDADMGRVEGAQVAAELEEGRAILFHFDVVVDLVLGEVVGGHEVPDSFGARVGGPATATPRFFV